MVEQLLKFNLPPACWLEFFSNLNSIAREEIEWEISDADAYKGSPAFDNLLQGYNGYVEQSNTFNNMKYKDMLSICYSLNPGDIVYSPGKEQYWRKIYDFLTQLFIDVPALSVEKEALLTGEERKQVFNETKTSMDLIAIINKMSEEEAGDMKDFPAFQRFIMSNPDLFSIEHNVSDSRTDYTIVFKRRAVLRSCLESIEFLLRKYESGQDPSSWRHV